MNEDDKRLIAWALRHYAEACEKSPMLRFWPQGKNRDAARARALADLFCPHSVWKPAAYSEWKPTVIKLDGKKEEE